MNLMIPKISILMSTYNRKDFLKYSIESGCGGITDSAFFSIWLVNFLKTFGFIPL